MAGVKIDLTGEAKINVNLDISKAKSSAEELSKAISNSYPQLTDFGDKVWDTYFKWLKDKQITAYGLVKTDDAGAGKEIEAATVRAQAALVLTREQIIKELDALKKAREEQKKRGWGTQAAAEPAKKSEGTPETAVSEETKAANLDKLIKYLEERLSAVKEGNLEALKIQEQTLLSSIAEGKLSSEKLKEASDKLVGVRKNINDLESDAGGAGKFLEKLGDGNKLKGMSVALSKSSEAALKLSASFGGVDTSIGYSLNAVGKLAGAAAEVGNAIASKDPVAIASAGVKAIGTVLSMNKKVKEMNAAARKEVSTYYANALKGEREYQEMLKQRELDTVRNNKTALQGIRDEVAIKQSQKTAYSEESEQIMAALQDKKSVSSMTSKHGTWLKKAKVKKTYESLAGKDFSELSELLAQGKLEGDAKSMVERLKELEQKGYDADKAIASLAKETSQLFTGTTADNLTTTLADMFKNGKTSAAELADFFKETMDNAALSVFKNKVLSGAMENFYAEFDKAAQSDDELTAEEYAELNGLFTKLTSEAVQKFEDFKKITGSGTAVTAATATAAAAVSGNIVAEAIKEDTANQALGIWRGQYDLTKQMTKTLSDTYSVAVNSFTVSTEIAAHTRRGADNTQGIADKLDKIIANTQQGDTLSQSLRNNGVNLG